MVEILSVVPAGLVAGAVHALSGPDHLAAVAPLSVTQARRAWRVGLLWGLGHAAGVGAIGSAVFLLRGLFDLEALSVWSERAVGLMLIGVGLWGLRKASSRWVHSHTHEHDSESHAHIHIHGPRWSRPSSSTSTPMPRSGWGFSTVLPARLTSSAFSPPWLPSALAAASYLGGYGVGNLVAMSGFAWLVGLASGRVSDHGVAPYRWALGACSALSIGIGLFWLVP